MTVESASYISDLSTSNPAAGDQKSEGDDHIRLLKTTIKATFPNVTGAVTPTHTQLNYVAGVTGAIQTQIDLKAPAASPAFTGTITGVNMTLSGALSVTGTVSFVSASSVAAPTPASTSNGTDIATTEYVQTAIAGATGGASRAEMYFYGSF